MHRAALHRIRTDKNPILHFLHTLVGDTAFRGFCMVLSFCRRPHQPEGDDCKNPLPWSRGMSVHFSRADAFRDRFKGTIAFEKVQIKAITVVHTAALTVFTHTRQILSMSC